MQFDQTEEDEASSEELGTSEETSESLESDASADEGTSEETNNSTSEAESSVEEEWLIPGRIKTKDELLQAYRNLETAYSQRGNEIHELRKQSQAKPRDPQQEIQRFAEDIKRNPVEAVRNVVRDETEAARNEVRRVRFESEYARLRSSNKEFAELEPTMAAIANQYSDLIRDNNMAQDPRLLHILYYAAKGAKQSELAAQAEARGKRKGESAAIKKVKAQVEGVSGSKGHTKKKFEELSLEEMEKEIARGNLG